MNPERIYSGQSEALVAEDVPKRILCDAVRLFAKQTYMTDRVTVRKPGGSEQLLRNNDKTSFLIIYRLSDCFATNKMTVLVKKGEYSEAKERAYSDKGY